MTMNAVIAIVFPVSPSVMLSSLVIRVSRLKGNSSAAIMLATPNAMENTVVQHGLITADSMYKFASANILLTRFQIISTF
ncbi:hypothetical protein F1645_00440 [Novacetimonas hansenii]|nr:hypothetical protein [Novacetimonas hansenii]GAN84377.1 hypothetical protein Gaha_0158_023 [Novacetimonas hansenii JCM 7643]GEC64894.1 hypothetical protein GHA01_27430 [Novacetimonas hansenii]